MIPHRGMEKDLMFWWLADSEERRTNCGFVLSFVGGFVNSKHNFFSGLCLMETTNKRGRTQLEITDTGKRKYFLPSRFLGEKRE